MIWLAGKSIDDIIKVPLEIKGRLSVRANYNNEVYLFNNSLIHYQVIPSNPKLRIYGWDIAVNVGLFYEIEHSFFDCNKVLQELKFWQIDIWDKIPEEFRDVVFYHELMEHDYLKEELSVYEAHKKAFIKEQVYVSKFLGLEQLKIFQNVLKDLGIIRNYPLLNT